MKCPHCKEKLLTQDNFWGDKVCSECSVKIPETIELNQVRVLLKDIVLERRKRKCIGDKIEVTKISKEWIEIDNGKSEIHSIPPKWILNNTKVYKESKDE